MNKSIAINASASPPLLLAFPRALTGASQTKRCGESESRDPPSSVQSFSSSFFLYAVESFLWLGSAIRRCCVASPRSSFSLLPPVWNLPDAAKECEWVGVCVCARAPCRPVTSVYSVGEAGVRVSVCDFRSDTNGA